MLRLSSGFLLTEQFVLTCWCQCYVGDFTLFLHHKLSVTHFPVQANAILTFFEGIERSFYNDFLLNNVYGYTCHKPILYLGVHNYYNSFLKILKL